MEETAAQRRRRRMRAEVTRVAVRLFAEQGYAGTTAEQVAAAADLSRSTLFRHFADKEDLLFGLEDDLLTTASRAVRAAPAGDPWAALCAASLFLAAEVAPLRELLVTRERVVATSPALQARAAGKHRRWEAALTEGLAEGRGADPGDAALLAKLAVGCFEVAQQRWLDTDGADLTDLLRAVLDRLPRLFEGRLGA